MPASASSIHHDRTPPPPLPPPLDEFVDTLEVQLALSELSVAASSVSLPTTDPVTLSGPAVSKLDSMRTIFDCPRGSTAIVQLASDGAAVFTLQSEFAIQERPLATLTLSLTFVASCSPRFITVNQTSVRAPLAGATAGWPEIVVSARSVATV